MSVARWAGFARKALQRSPRYVLWRAGEELRRQGRRPESARPRLPTDRGCAAAAGATSIDACGNARGGPFFVTPTGERRSRR
jgi:hypothetical protein